MLPADAVVVLKMFSTKSDPQHADPSKPSSFSHVMVLNKAFLPPWLASSNS
jgi:hypothetical protein